jgi:hypothetical protein
MDWSFEEETQQRLNWWSRHLGELGEYDCFESRLRSDVRTGGWGSFKNLPRNRNRERFAYCRMDINEVTNGVAFKILAVMCLGRGWGLFYFWYCTLINTMWAGVGGICRVFSTSSRTTSSKFAKPRYYIPYRLQWYNPRNPSEWRR